MSFPYPYEQYTPSPVASTPVSQWEVLQPQDAVSPPQQQATQAPSSETTPTVAPTTYEPPPVIQIPERRRRQIFFPSPPTPSSSLNPNPNINPNLNPNPSQSTSTGIQVRSDINAATAQSQRHGSTGDAYDTLREQTSPSDPQVQSQGQVGPIRHDASGVNRSAVRASHPYQRPEGRASAAIASGQASTHGHSEREGLQPLHTTRPPSRLRVSQQQVERPSQAALLAAASRLRSLLKSRSNRVSPSMTLFAIPPYELPEDDDLTHYMVPRTDLHYSEERDEITVLMELPGIKKEDLSVKLGFCRYARTKQIVVSGKTNIPFEETDGVYAQRELKCGEYRRVLCVPFDTTLDNLTVKLEHGILSVKFPAGNPVEDEESVDIPIRWD